jgi:hypothetical protein
MIGYGKIFEWYYEGVIDDDSEVVFESCCWMQSSV